MFFYTFDVHVSMYPDPVQILPDPGYIFGSRTSDAKNMKAQQMAFEII